MRVKNKIKTGIKGLDDTLEGGINPGRGILLVGGPGTGKTILMTEFIYRGIHELKENGVFVTFEERPKYIMENMSSFEWDLPKLVEQRKLAFVDASPGAYCEELSDCYDLEPILARIKFALQKVHGRRVVIDGLGNLFEKFQNKKVVREIIFNISDELKRLGVTYFISSEKQGAQLSYSVEEYAADGVVELSREENQQFVNRHLEIIKMRGASFRAGKIFFEISSNGVTLYPRLLLIGSQKLSLTYKRSKFGIPDLDKILNGGLPEGAMTVIAGATGTGKTTMAMRFLYEGLKNNENGLCITFKDSRQSIERLGETFHWRLKRYEKEGKLFYIDKPEYPDKLIYQVMEKISAENIKRVVIDSLVFVDPLLLFPTKVTEFYITLIRWLKIKGITAVVTYLTMGNNFNETYSPFLALEGPLRRALTAMPDGIIVLNYDPDARRLSKQLSILKLRDSDYGREYYPYEIDKNGFNFNNKKVIAKERG